MTGAEPNILEVADFAGWWDLYARLRPDQLALADSEMRLTWREAALTAHRLGSALLALDLKPKDIVASWLPNWIESYVIRVACEHAGLAWLPILGQPART